MNYKIVFRKWRQEINFDIIIHIFDLAAFVWPHVNTKNLPTFRGALTCMLIKKECMVAERSSHVFILMIA